MINSDNVVRGGLTPKHKDTKTLLKLLDFQARREFDLQLGQELYIGKEKCSLLQYLSPDYPELRVLRVKMSKREEKEFTLMGKKSKIIPVKLPLPNLSFLGLLIVLSGEALVESIDSFENRKGIFHSDQQD